MNEPLSAITGIGLAVMLLLAALYLTIAHLRQRASPVSGHIASHLVWLAVSAQILDQLIPAFVRRFLQVRIKQAGLQAPVTASLLILSSGALAVSTGLFFFWLSTGNRFVSYPGFPVTVVIVALSFWLPWEWLRRRLLQRHLSFVRDLPLMLDLVGMSVSQGDPLLVAVEHAVQHVRPGPLREEFIWVLRDMRAGRSRERALTMLRDRCPTDAMRDAVAAMINSEKQGTDLSELLFAQAAQRRDERFADAERRAMQAPVKLLLPLLVFIFPGTFLILMYPVVRRLLETGLM